MSNMENCLQTKDMTAVEALQAMVKLAGKIKGPVGLGIWEGSISGKISGQTHGGAHVAVFQDTALVAPFGPQGDTESEASAALFALAVTNAAKFDELVKTLPDMLEALRSAEDFMAGFEGDEVQEGIDGKLSSIRAVIAKVASV